MMSLVKDRLPVRSSTFRGDVGQVDRLPAPCQRLVAHQPVLPQQGEQCQLGVGVVLTRDRGRQGDQDAPFPTVRRG